MSLECAGSRRTNRLEGTDIAETIDMARNRERSGDRRRGEPAALAPAADGLDHRLHGRRALRHPRSGEAGRGDDRAARRRRGDVLHRTVGGLQPARAHVVPDPGQDALPVVGRGVDRVPRGRTRPSSAGRPGAVPARPPRSLPARVVGFGPRRGLGVVRRAAHGRVGVLRTTRSTDWGSCARRRCAAVRVIVDLGMHLRAGDTRRANRSTRASAGHRSSVKASSTNGRGFPSTSWRARSCATSAGPRRRSATRSASASGWQGAPRPRCGWGAPST